MTNITLPRAELQQVLEALEEINKLSIGENAICLPAEIDGAMDALRERLAQPAQDWDWRHPKAQALIGAKARLEIKLRLVEQLVEDPNFETTASDMEYWEPLHDKLQGRLAQPEQEPVAGEPLPCPFCGNSGLDFDEGSTYRWGIASCSGCGASCGEIRREYPDKGEWHKEAIAEWNRRASPPAQRKPLTDGECDDLWDQQTIHITDKFSARNFIRDVEAAHGIKGEA